eukprot:g8318.t1 g8318   contig29:243867-244751(+)
MAATTTKKQSNVSTHTIASSSVREIKVHVFEPFPSSQDVISNNSIVCGTIVTVHPWATLGGGEHNTIRLARHITTSNTNEKKWRVITFPLKSTPIKRGGAIWGIVSKHSFEVQQIVDVVQWAFEKYDSSVVLLGSSAGAPMAGSAMSEILKRQQDKKQQLNEDENRITNSKTISAYVAVGYTFGKFASLGFGRHFSSVVGRPPTTLDNLCGSGSTSSCVIALPPKLFIMGENDEFTAVDQLEAMVSEMKKVGENLTVDSVIVPNVGHFELESPSYDGLVAKMILDWLSTAPADS